jgi:hypothetical protein
VTDALESTFRTTFGTSSTLLNAATSSSVQFTEVTAAKINNLDGNGDNVLQAATHKLFSPVLVGSNAGALLPAQNSVAVSLTAGTKPNGTPYKGRFYLPPCTSTALAAGGLLQTTTRSSYNQWASGWLNALKAAGVTPGVWSRKFATVTPVGIVRVGDRVDTIRSRRNKGTENYVQSVVT